MYELKISSNGHAPLSSEHETLLDAMRAVDQAAADSGLVVRCGTTRMAGFLVDQCEARFGWEIAAVTSRAADQAELAHVDGDR